MKLTVKREDYVGNYGMEELFKAPDYDQCIRWGDEALICWSDNPFYWDEVCLVLELISGGASPIKKYEKWDKKKQRRFITLYCKVKSQTSDYYTSMDAITKVKPENVKLTAEDVQLVIDTVLPTVKVEVEI